MAKKSTYKEINLNVGRGLAELVVRWYQTSSITVSTTLNSGTSPVTHTWVVPGIPAGGWPLTLVQMGALREALEAELPSLTVPHLGPFGMRVEHAITPLLQAFTDTNSAMRQFSVSYQRKALQERFGKAKVIAAEDGVTSHDPFILVWQRPMRGGEGAAARGLVKGRKGIPLLEPILKQANGKGIVNVLSVQDVAERLWHIEATLSAMGVKHPMLVNTHLTINPRLPTSRSFWAKSMLGGVGYTSLTFLRLEAASWVLVTARRLTTQTPVKQTILALPIVATVAALVSHMQARDLHMTVNTAQRMMILLTEWREGQELSRLKRQPRTPRNPFLPKTEEPVSAPVERDPVYDRIRDELVEWLHRDESVLQDVNNLLGKGLQGSDLF